MRPGQPVASAQAIPRNSLQYVGAMFHDLGLNEQFRRSGRPDFKRNILQAFTEGFAPKPETTFGNVKADVLERFVPGYRRGNFVDIIENSAWPE
jgi:hypothetical protein